MRSDWYLYYGLGEDGLRRKKEQMKKESIATLIALSVIETICADHVLSPAYSVMSPEEKAALYKEIKKSAETELKTVDADT